VRTLEEGISCPAKRASQRGCKTNCVNDVLR